MVELTPRILAVELGSNLHASQLAALAALSYLVFFLLLGQMARSAKAASVAQLGDLQIPPRAHNK